MNRLALCLLTSLSFCAAGEASAQTLQSSEFSYQFENRGRNQPGSLSGDYDRNSDRLERRGWDTNLSWDRPRNAPLEDYARMQRFYNAYDRY